MADRTRRPQPLGISRRAFVAGLATALLPPREGEAANADRPPVFRGTRRQFTIVEPAVPFPSVTLANTTGQFVSLAHNPGRILLVNIWAMWCAVCRTELPMLERFHKMMGDRVEVAAICTDRIVARKQIAAYLDELKIRSLPIYLDQQGALAGDPKSPLPVIGMPLTYLITPSGRIAGYISGIADWIPEDGQALLAHYSR